MTTKSHSTPLARLSRIGLALGIGSTQATRNGEDDSYIPYNGPYELPTKGQTIRGYWDSGGQDPAPSFAHLSFDQEKPHTPYNQAPHISNGRKYPDASRVTLSNIMTGPRRRFGRVHQNSTPPPRASFVPLDQGGGVGDTPVPAHRSTPSQSGSSKVSSHTFLVRPRAYTPFQRHDSVFRASVTDPRKSSSRTDDKHEKTRPFWAPTDDLASSAVTFPSVYEPASRRSRSNSVAVRRKHPYAIASPNLGKTSPIRVEPRSQEVTHVKAPQKKVPAHLQPSSRVSLLKASISTPDLRSASRQPAMYVKTKTHWLSAETWCDAFVFPRPRFLLRHLEEGTTTSEHRLLSPAESIISEPRETPADPKSLKRSQSASELRISGFTKAAPTRAERNHAAKSPPAPRRPRSFTLNDLSPPSPIPSFITYVLTWTGANQHR